MILIMSHGFHTLDSVECMISFMGFDWLTVYCDMTHVSHLRYLELSMGQGGHVQKQPPAVFPALPHSTGWGRVGFLAFPAAIAAEAGPPPIPQTDLSKK